MAKETTRMPQSSAGLMSFNEDMHSKISFQPSYVIVFCIIVILIIAALHVFGAQLLTA
ncbi:preprotein translocase subunit Sec61beta [Candidatus Woesearchaeota archaeon]|nr:preprotein translocase subunit Sec61beta [Candidatus Woesearchaeota archaeon]